MNLDQLKALARAACDSHSQEAEQKDDGRQRFTHEELLKKFDPRADARLAVAERMAQALWVCVEHNRLHFGESHNTVIDGGAVLAEWEAL